jgi:hypothetical protein
MGNFRFQIEEDGVGAGFFPDGMRAAKKRFNSHRSAFAK